jgi:hypothetical protein
MNGTRYWETTDGLMTISVCSEGCIHLTIGRAVVKMTREEFFSLANLANKAAREIPFPAPTHQPLAGH